MCYQSGNYRLKETTYLFTTRTQEVCKLENRKGRKPIFSNAAHKNALHHLDLSHVCSSHHASQPMLSLARVYELVCLYETYNVFQSWVFYFDDKQVMHGMGEESRKTELSRRQKTIDMPSCTYINKKLHSVSFMIPFL